MAEPAENPPLSGGALLSGLLLGAWIVACDGWVKVLARAGCCDATGRVGDAAAAVLTVPADCRPIDLLGGVQLLPQVREGATPLGIALPSGSAAVYGLGLFAIATVLSILVLRWRARRGGDMLALGTLWAGAALHGLPRLAAGGGTFTELVVAGVGVGIADLALAWALLWLAWRMLAQLRG